MNTGALCIDPEASCPRHANMVLRFNLPNGFLNNDQNMQTIVLKDHLSAICFIEIEHHKCPIPVYPILISDAISTQFFTELVKKKKS